MIMDIWRSIEKKQFAPVYLLYGTEAFLINETKQMLTKHVLSEEEVDFNLSVFDLEETPIEAALEDVETLPFLGERKLVFLQNAFFLTAEKNKSKVEHDVSRLEAYLADPAPYSIVAIAAPYEKLDDRKKITKELKRKAAVLEAKKLNEQDLRIWLRERAAAAGVQIHEEAISLLIEISGTNLMLLANEMEKLSLYAEEKLIDAQMVEMLVAKSFEQNIFTLIDKILQRKVEPALSIYYELLRQNEEPIKILAVMAGQIRMLYQVKELARQGYGQQKIASVLKVHPYRVKLAMEKAGRFSEKELMRLIYQLAEADYQIKTGQAEKRLAIELILLKMGT
ncbi:DNA polymerase III subunit delta [Peribacillus deserti]|uniref:DNA polymerase III subunit delta n=1 Tax=Peribacillus deserti TaxID=673318 RepID=A0A2N5M9B2_9BACI|nr:DNA polymerase III subunit delta [Peribacillus deserti]PLT30944.1 DNA polymerase III subunit delta [Peribacillus deserti]